MIDLPLYLQIRFCSSCVMTVLGALLLFGIIPRRLRGSLYDVARRRMGFAMVLLATNAFIYILSGMWHNPDRYLLEMNISWHYATAFIIAISFIMLLGHQVDRSGKRYKVGLAMCLLYPVFIWSAVFVDNELWQRIAESVSMAVFVLAIGWMIVLFFRFYREAILRSQNYYSDDIEVNIRWIYKSTVNLFFLAIISVLTVVLSDYIIWAGAVFSLYSVWVFSYIFFSFIKFVRDMEDSSYGDDSAVLHLDEPTPDVATSSLSEEMRLKIEEKLNLWISAKWYKRRGITIESVSRDIYTNRTYLSIYINTTYGCSFKTWVSRLRIVEAKRLLSESELSVLDVSNRVGFASPTSFTNVFKQMEGTSPQRWRQSCAEEVVA